MLRRSSTPSQPTLFHVISFFDLNLFVTLGAALGPQVLGRASSLRAPWWVSLPSCLPVFGS